MRLAPVRARQSRRPGGTRIAAGAAAALAIMLAAGCSSGPAPGGSSAAAITVAAVPGIDNAPLYLAQHDHLFSDAGVRVTIRTYSSVAREVSALSSGHVDIAAGDYASFLYKAATAPGFLGIVADGYDAAPGVMEIVTLPGSHITGPAQLANKVIGIPDTPTVPTGAGHPDSLAMAAAQSVLTSDGVNLTTISWQPIPPQQLVRALQDHLVDAILVTEPYIYQAESQLGAIEVLDAASGPTASLPLSGYFATQAWARDNSAAVRDFRSALEQAQTSAAMPGQVQDVLPHYAGLTAQQSQLVTIGTYPTSTNVTDLERVAQLMYTSGMLRSPLPIPQMIIR
jgi:NitT/TauT family transport system substrate-binding protein